MKEKPPDKFAGAQRHLFPPAAVAVITPLERDSPVIKLENTVVGDGHTVRIPPEIFHDAGGIPKRRLTVDPPLFLVTGVQKILVNIRYLQLQQ